MKNILKVKNSEAIFENEVFIETLNENIENMKISKYSISFMQSSNNSRASLVKNVSQWWVESEKSRKKIHIDSGFAKTRYRGSIIFEINW